MASTILFIFIFTQLQSFYFCFEPISAGSGVLIVTAAVASYNYLHCKQYECCDDGWIKYNGLNLQSGFKDYLYGQHLAEFTIRRTLSGYLKNKNPKKALVMSFHGITGSGKNHVSKMIAESLYRKGLKSDYVHLYIANQHFPHKEQISAYQNRLRKDIPTYTKQCGRSMFIFDEVDKMPPGTLDALKPFLDYHEQIDGVDYRKNIFIFLSNAGSTGIVDIALKFWSDGRSREEITMKNIEHLISKGAFNEIGGFQFSELLSSELIDLYVPFLPLEKKHVRKCIEADLKTHNRPIKTAIVNEIAEQLVYFPPESELYAASGCKRISQKVNLFFED